MLEYDNITSTGGTATADGDMWAVNADVARSFTLADGSTVSPFASVQVGKVDLTATTGTLTGVGLSDTVNISETSLGVDVAHALGNGSITMGVSIDYFDTDAPTALLSGQFDQTGWSGTARVGYDTVLGNGVAIQAGISFGGLGTSNREYAGSFRVGYQF